MDQQPEEPLHDGDDQETEEDMAEILCQTPKPRPIARGRSNRLKTHDDQGTRGRRGPTLDLSYAVPYQTVISSGEDNGTLKSTYNESHFRDIQTSEDLVEKVTAQPEKWLDTLDNAKLMHEKLSSSWRDIRTQRDDYFNQIEQLEEEMHDKQLELDDARGQTDQAGQTDDTQKLYDTEELLRNVAKIKDRYKNERDAARSTVKDLTAELKTTADKLKGVIVQFILAQDLHLVAGHHGAMQDLFLDTKGIGLSADEAFHTNAEQLNALLAELGQEPLHDLRISKNVTPAPRSLANPELSQLLDDSDEEPEVVAETTVRVPLNDLSARKITPYAQKMARGMQTSAGATPAKKAAFATTPFKDLLNQQKQDQQRPNLRGGQSSPDDSGSSDSSDSEDSRSRHHSKRDKKKKRRSRSHSDSRSRSHHRRKRNPFEAPKPFMGDPKKDPLPYEEWAVKQKLFLRGEQKRDRLALTFNNTTLHAYNTLLHDFTADRFRTVDDLFAKMDDNYTNRYETQRKRTEFLSLAQGVKEGFNDFWNRFSSFRPYLSPIIRDNEEALLEALRDRLNPTCRADIRGKDFDTVDSLVTCLRKYELSYIREGIVTRAAPVGAGSRQPTGAGANPNPGTGADAGTDARTKKTMLEKTNASIPKDYDWKALALGKEWVPLTAAEFNSRTHCYACRQEGHGRFNDEKCPWAPHRHSKAKKKPLKTSALAITEHGEPAGN
jgi:hypothetical protein